MFIIIDCDDMQSLLVVREDNLISSEINIESPTLYFESYIDANEYAERHIGECQIVEVDA